MRLKKGFIIMIIIFSFLVIGCEEERTIANYIAYENININEYKEVYTREIDDYINEKIVLQGTVEYIEENVEDIEFYLDVVNMDILDKQEVKFIWKSNDEHETEELLKDIKYAMASENDELIRVYGIVDKDHSIVVHDIHYIGESYGGISIWDCEEAVYTGFNEIYKKTGGGYFYKEIEACKDDLEASWYDTDESRFLDVSCYEAQFKIPLKEKISINGKASYIWADGYNNIYFSLKDESSYISCFWYNNDFYKYMKYIDVFEDAINYNREVVVYGVYQENPKDLGEYNLYIYDIKLGQKI